MKNLFEHTSSPWIRYSSYEYRTAEDGTLYIVVSADAKPEMYNPMKDAESLVLDAVNIGLQVMHKAPEDELKSMVLRFINSYGFLGFMTALPTTAEFITYVSCIFISVRFVLLGFKHPDKFGYIGAFCPLLALSRMVQKKGFLQRCFTLPDAYKENTLVMIVKGKNDTTVGNNPILYHKALEKNNVPHIYYETMGGDAVNRGGGGHQNVVYLHGL